MQKLLFNMGQCHTRKRVSTVHIADSNSNLCVNYHRLLNSEMEKKHTWCALCSSMCGPTIHRVVRNRKWHQHQIGANMSASVKSRFGGESHAENCPQCDHSVVATSFLWRVIESSTRANDTIAMLEVTPTMETWQWKQKTACN